MAMTWKELYNYLKEHQNSEWLDNSVYTYDRTKGEYYPADLVEFQDDDDIIDNIVFVEFESFV